MCEQYSISGRMKVLYKYKRALGGMNFLARDRQPTRIAADIAIPEIYMYMYSGGTIVPGWGGVPSLILCTKPI